MFSHVLFVMTLLRGWVQMEAAIFVKNDIGDTYECVGMYQQPAFRHPTLRNHTIKIRPSKKLLDLEQHGHKGKSSNSTHANLVKCPPGSVPIPRERVNKQNIELSTYPTRYSVNDNQDLRFAGLRVSGKIFTGAKASISLYNPQVYDDNEFSSAMISIEQGPDQIKVGWMVNPQLYGDRQTRFFTWWTATDDKGHTTGCYNVMCPGFVIVSDVFPLNYAFPKMSQPFQKSVEAHVDVTRDLQTGEWKLKLDDVLLGYWPESLFTSLRSLKANVMRFGGEVWTPEGEVIPQMGSGTFQNAQYDLTCYFSNMYFNDDRGFPTDPTEYGTVEPVESDCFFEGDNSEKDHDDLGYSFVFGGEGGHDITTC